MADYTIVDVVKDIFTFNLKIASPEVVTERRSMCGQCDARSGARCTVCGCFIAAKTKLKPSNCPMGLWNPEP